MKIAKIVFFGAAILTINAALAQQELTGTLTVIDRIDRNVVIQRTQQGTVGTSAGAAEMLKVPPALALDNVHVGDKVTYAATETGGTKTITKLEKQ